MKLPKSLKNKKGELSIQIIIVAIILLVVLVVLIFIFSDKMGGWLKGTSSCAAKGGACGTFDCKQTIPDKFCEDATCIANPGTQCGDPKSQEGRAAGVTDDTIKQKTAKNWCCVPILKKEQ